MIPDVPPAPELPDDPVAAIRARRAANGLALHARTALPLWLGERLDVAYAINVLHRLVTMSPSTSMSASRPDGVAGSSAWPSALVL